ncbi:hypothetical protein [Burkholderia cenocepacia]|uniref:hypothetical protein n=1 Tax=Burkholderia cenocepacia TaxID=95486 RepID=UPI0022381130|nr:hypothetical protein [Burkholderia cenocepacia]MCW5156344.1 hypothetical protein [Burkholderia cenocepacia]
MDEFDWALLLAFSLIKGGNNNSFWITLGVAWFIYWLPCMVVIILNAKIEHDNDGGIKAMQLTDRIKVADDVEAVKKYIASGHDIHYCLDFIFDNALACKRPLVCEYLISLDCDPRGFLNDKFFSNEEKAWARKFLEERNLAHKFDSEPQGKTTTGTGRIKI